MSLPHNLHTTHVHCSFSGHGGNCGTWMSWCSCFMRFCIGSRFGFSRLYPFSSLLFSVLHLFLTCGRGLPSNIRAILTQSFPYWSTSDFRSVSSSAVHGLLFALGDRCCSHLSLHCLLFLPGIRVEIRVQSLSPYLSTRSFSNLSSTGSNLLFTLWNLWLSHCLGKFSSIHKKKNSKKKNY